MKASVYDTYVKKPDQTIMHFDILVPEETPFTRVETFGKAYLQSKGLGQLTLSSKECRFCHIEEANPVLEAQLTEHGYSIIELQNC